MQGHAVLYGGNERLASVGLKIMLAGSKEHNKRLSNIQIFKRRAFSATQTCT